MSQFEYKKKVTIILESNSKPDLERIANRYYNPNIAKDDNDSEDKEKFVSLNIMKEDL